MIIDNLAENLQELKNVDICKVDINTLVDIQNVNVNRHLKQPERILDYIEQIKNPYCFRHGDYVIKVSFSENERTLDDCLKAYVNQITMGQIRNLP